MNIQALSSVDLIETAGTLFQVALPVGAGLYSSFRQDCPGTLELILLAGVNQVALWAFKKYIPSTRPNGKSGSFPSGHTAAAFLAPAYLVKRYGMHNMPISTALTTIGVIGVGVSRLIAKAHWKLM